MSNEYKDDEIMGKAYDSRLMKRLLQYAKPYFLYLLLAIIMMIGITALELLRPYLLKITIDDYITGYKKPMYEMEINDPHKGIIFNNKKYVRLDSIDIEERVNFNSYPVVNIIQENGEYYLGDYNSEI